MTTITIDRAVVEQALEALIIAWQQQPRWQITDSMHALRAALAQRAEPQDAELSAALGWPGGISEPVLDRKTLLRQVADLRAAPPQRLPLTEEEILEAVGWERAEMYMKLTPNFPVEEARKETIKNARAVERAVWEKNHG